VPHKQGDSSGPSRCTLSFNSCARGRREHASTAPARRAVEASHGALLDLLKGQTQQRTPGSARLNASVAFSPAVLRLHLQPTAYGKTVNWCFV